LKKLNNQQKNDHESIQLGMWKVTQMHCNDTGTTNDKSFQETLEIIRMKHLKDMKFIKVRVENEISNILPEQATETATMDANSKNDPVTVMKKVMMTTRLCYITKTTKKVAYLMTMMTIMTVNNKTQLIQKQVQKK
jgi:hypothetical protein